MKKYICPKCNKTIYSVGEKLVKGHIAHHGCVVGHVKLIRKSSDLAQVSDGDILVTGQTSPEAVPAMFRAGAVVTDRGGILCHAAIVCREFKKPCVVGTTTATNILHTGDLILVAACTGEIFNINAK